MSVCRITLLTAFSTLLAACHAIYLPGIAPIDYCERESVDSTCRSKIELFVNRLTSDHVILPFEYYHFDFCEQPSNAQSPSENLAQILFGQRIRPSPYQISFNRDNGVCRVLCTRNYSMSNKEHRAALEELKLGVFNNYYHHWIVDNLPVTWCYNTLENEQYCSPGFPLGCYEHPNSTHSFSDACSVNSHLDPSKAWYLFNHISLTISYHPEAETQANGHVGRIVSIKAVPQSVNHGSSGGDKNCDKTLSDNIPLAFPHDLSAKQSYQITYSYSVHFVADANVKWSSRWDYVLESTSGRTARVQWFSILNSCVIVLCLSGMVAMVLMHILRKDISRYNQLEDGIDDDDDEQEETGWKLVHGDVFRPPDQRFSILLAVFVGSGTQVLAMTAITLFLVCVGYVSPTSRGSVMSYAIALGVLMSILAGYVSARMYKTFGGLRWKLNVLMTAILCPGYLYAHFIGMNLILWYEGSSAAVPFSVLLEVLALWLLVAVPLTYLGAVFGFRMPPIRSPTRTNQIPRQIPDRPGVSNKLLANLLIAGLLPFGCIFIQLFFVLTSIWSAVHVYLMYGFLFIVFLILIITTSETTILIVYFQLCAENHRWWWRSFLCGGAISFYLVLYSVHFFFVEMEVSGLASTILYFGYTSIIVFLVFLCTGAVGFLGAYWFVCKIFSSVKVD